MFQSCGRDSVDISPDSDVCSSVSLYQGCSGSVRSGPVPKRSSSKNPVRSGLVPKWRLQCSGRKSGPTRVRMESMIRSGPVRVLSPSGSGSQIRSGSENLGPPVPERLAPQRFEVPFALFSLVLDTPAERTPILHASLCWARVCQQGQVSPSRPLTRGFVAPSAAP